MRYELFDYQQEAVEKLVRQIGKRQSFFEGSDPEYSAIVLAAPTGAGKTVIATAVMEHLLGYDSDILDPSEGRTVLWLTDDKSLNAQTLEKMIVASDQWFMTTMIESGSFDQEVFERGGLYFMHTQAASSTTRLAKSSDTQSYPIWETIANTVKKLGSDFIVVIDEAHRGTQLNRDTPTTVSKVIDGTPEYGHERVPIVVGISATAERFMKSMKLNFSKHASARLLSSVDVPGQAVKDVGIIKDKVVLHSPHEAGAVEADTTLMRLAVQRIRDVESKWAAYGQQEGLERPVKPVLVVQVENGADDDWLGVLAGIVMQEWPGVTIRQMVNVFGEHTDRKTVFGDIGYIEPHKIEGADDIRVVFAKDAITTGWDCPRAEVLISFRTAVDATYIAQLIGRIVRQPLARRVLSDESLNAVYCVLPRFNGTQVDNVAGFFNEGIVGETGPTIVKETIENTYNSTLDEDEDLFELEAETAATVEEKQIAREVQEERSGAKPTPVEDGTEWTFPKPKHTAETVAPTPGPAGASSPLTSTPVEPTSESAPAEQPADAAERTPAPVAPAPSGEPAAVDFADGELFDFEPTPAPKPAAKAKPRVVRALEAIPSYTIPNRPARGSHVARLHNLASLLSESTILPGAKANADTLLHKHLDGIAEMRKDELDKRAKAISHVVVGSRAFTTDGVALIDDADTGTRKVRLDKHNIDGVFDEVKRLYLRDGLATTYWKAHVADDASDVVEVKIRVAALGSMPGVAASVEEYAEELVDKWLQQYKLAITELEESSRTAFKRLQGESRMPSEAPIKMPKSIDTDAVKGNGSDEAVDALRDSKDRYPKHVFADAGAKDGKFYCQLSQWESGILRSQLDRDDTAAWYRNPSRGGEKSLCIPYEVMKEGKRTYAGLYPDFIILRKEGTGSAMKLRPVIIDPHGHHLPDSGPKLRGMIAYAEEHGAAFKAIYPIIQDPVDKKDLALPLHSAETRKEVLAELDAGTDLVEIYRKHGGAL